MDNHPSHSPLNKTPGACPDCGFGLDPDQNHTTCPSCGKFLDEGLSLSDSQRKGLEDLVAGANETLVKAGADSAEQSFGLGCALGGLIILGAAGALYLFGVFNLVLAFIVLIMGSLAVTGIAVLVASFAKTRGVTLKYRMTVLPEIEIYLKKNNVSQDQFERVVVAALPPNAPLRSCLPVSSILQ
jgi:hypothetical protein